MITAESVQFYYNVAFGVLFGFCGILLFYIIRQFSADDKKETGSESKNECVASPSNKKKETATSGKPKKQRGGVDSRWSNRSEKQQAYKHPWLLTTLKGHEGQLKAMDFASNGKYLVSGAEDSTVVVWDVKDFNQKNRKSFKCNLDNDVATLVSWSPDSRGFIVRKSQQNECEAFKLDKNTDGTIAMNAQKVTKKAMPFQSEHKDDIIGLEIACNGKYIMTCSADGAVVIWEPKGTVLAGAQTASSSAQCAKVSPCGRFVVVGSEKGNSKEVLNVWEITYDSMGQFSEMKSVPGINIPKCNEVLDVAFDQDTSQMAIVNGPDKPHWELFYTNVELRKGMFLRSKSANTCSENGTNPKIALSGNGDVLAVAFSSTFEIFSTLDGQLQRTIADGDAEIISTIKFDTTNNHILVAIDKYIRVFHNVIGYRNAITSAREILKEHQTSATKERLQKLIADHEAFLATIQED